MTKKSCIYCAECDWYEGRCELHNMPIPADEDECKMIGQKCEDFKIFEKEVIIADGNGDYPYLHAGRYESHFYDKHFQHNIMTRFPWSGKVKITIERLKE